MLNTVFIAATYFVVALLALAWIICLIWACVMTWNMRWDFPVMCIMLYLLYIALIIITILGGIWAFTSADSPLLHPETWTFLPK